MIRVLIWNEFVNEKTGKKAGELYPDGIHKAIASFLESEDDIEVRTATLDDEGCGITPEILAETDVIIWWGHVRHSLVPDDVANAVRDAVLDGMGAIFLHSAHHAKPFKALIGTSANLTWRESEDEEIVWVVEPSHPITQGIDRYFKIDREETYGEPFVIPTPDKLLFLSNFSGGEAFRSGCLWERGNGKVFYFQPGHETLPTYYIPEVQTVIRNAVRFLAPANRQHIDCPHVRKISDAEPYVVKHRM